MHVPDRQAVIRLEELEDISVVASPRGCCGCPDGPDHLVITVQQSAHEKEAFRLIGAAAHVDGYAARSGRLAAVIAGPKDGEAFCAAVRAQAEKVRRENLDTDPPSPETREILPRRSGAPAGVAAPKPLEMAWARERAPAEKVVPAGRRWSLQRRRGLASLLLPPSPPHMQRSYLLPTTRNPALACTTRPSAFHMAWVPPRHPSISAPRRTGQHALPSCGLGVCSAYE